MASFIGLDDLQFLDLIYFNIIVLKKFQLQLKIMFSSTYDQLHSCAEGSHS